MPSIYILCVEDEPEVLEAVVQDLVSLEKTFPLETARTADEARKVIASLLARGDSVGVILCDHILPGQNGVDLLIDLQRDPATAPIRKVLLTGQAGLEPTVRAVNDADLNHYIAKPWSREELVAVVKKELTEYVLHNEPNLLPFLGVLDTERLTEALRQRGLGDR
jgi:response regulator RpfG family c-di-GMP phosphodiesterase